MDEIVLEFLDKKIKILIYDKRWGEMYWVKNEEIIVLGGERLDKIISGLSNLLNDKIYRRYFEYRNMELFTILNLMGPHAVIAGRENEDNTIELIFLDVNGNLLPMGCLEIDKIIEWINKLKECDDFLNL